jgi:hypothetical protein
MKHKLHLQQIKRFIENSETLPPQWKNFISSVDEAYQQRDNDFYLLEHRKKVLSEEFDEKRTRVESLFMRISKEGILH